MVSRGNFDEMVRQETRRTVGSQRNADGGENARDRVARRQNQKEGRSAFKSSSAYRPSDDKPAAKKSKGGGKSSKGGGGGGGRTSSTRAPMQGPPASAKLGPQQGPPMSARTVDTSNDPLALLIPLLLANIRGRGAMGGADANAPGTDITFPAQEPTPVPLQRVPNDIDANTGLPAPKPPLPLAGPPEQLALPQQKLLPYYPGQSDAASVPSNDLDVRAGRFFDEGEIGNMAGKMPGVIKSPGWGPTKLPKGMRP